MSAAEIPLCFDCQGTPLVGMAHPAADAKTGVLIVVGGPQYRIGAHRQFIEMARGLAQAGIPSFRFDARGMGDSGGDFQGFEAIDDDIKAAIDAFMATAPDLENVVLWGLCDAASAILFYAHRDPRVAGAILLNPWVRTETSYAKTELKHYYGAKIIDGRFWRRLFTGDIDLADAAGSFLKRVKSATGFDQSGDGPTGSAPCQGMSLSLPDRMLQGFTSFTGDIMLIISGNDLTAREFEEITEASPDWTQALSADRVRRHHIKASDHTFSRREWSEAVMNWTIGWITDLK